jgi:hypothetical protein
MPAAKRYIEEHYLVGGDDFDAVLTVELVARVYVIQASAVRKERPGLAVV